MQYYKRVKIISENPKSGPSLEQLINTFLSGLPKVVMVSKINFGTNQQQIDHNNHETIHSVLIVLDIAFEDKVKAAEINKLFKDIQKL